MKRFNHHLFLLVLFASTLTVKPQTDNTNPFVSVTARKSSKTEVADISFVLKDDSKVNKVYVKLPKSKEMTEVDVSGETVNFIKVKLATGVNVINLQAFGNDDQFIGNGSVTINYTPTGEKQPPVDDGVIGATKTPSDGDDKTPGGKADDKKATVTVTPKEDISLNSLYTVTITPKNLPADTSRIVVKRLAEGKKEEAEQQAEYKRGDRDFTLPILATVELKKGENKIQVFAYQTAPDSSVAEPKEKLVGNDETLIVCDPCGSNNQSVNTRAIVGIEQAGASSANSESRPFVNLFVNAPLSFRGSTDPALSAWADFRFTSTTVQSFARLANVSNTLINPFFGGNSEINNVVQSFQLNTGFDFRIVPEGSLQGFFIPGKHSVSFIAGGGVTNPLKSDQTAQIFKIPTITVTPGASPIPDPTFTALFPGVDFNGKANIAFISPERDRFFRRWFAGLRVKTRFFENEERSSLINQSPAMFDITIGQDEAITRKLTGKILTLEGFTPFPIRKFDYIYLFGGVSTRLTRKVNETIPPFFLEPVTNVSLTNNNTVTVPIDTSSFTRSNRDTFRFGIGIDLIRLLVKTDAPTKK